MLQYKSAEIEGKISLFLVNQDVKEITEGLPIELFSFSVLNTEDLEENINSRIAKLTIRDQRIPNKDVLASIITSVILSELNKHFKEK